MNITDITKCTSFNNVSDIKNIAKCKHLKISHDRRMVWAIMDQIQMYAQSASLQKYITD